MSPQLQQVLAEIDRLSSVEQIQVIEHITVNLKEVVPTTTQPSKSKSSALILEKLHADEDLGFSADRYFPYILRSCRFGRYFIDSRRGYLIFSHD